MHRQIINPRVENMVVRQYLTASVGLFGGDGRGCGVQAGGGVDGAQAARRHRPGDRHIGGKLEGGASVDHGRRRRRDDYLSSGCYAAKEREEKRQLNPYNLLNPNFLNAHSILFQDKLLTFFDGCSHAWRSDLESLPGTRPRNAHTPTPLQE